MKAYPISENGEVIEIEVTAEEAERITKTQLREKKNEKRAQ